MIRLKINELNKSKYEIFPIDKRIFLMYKHI